MNPRLLIALLLALAAVGWWFSPVSPRAHRAPALMAGAVPGCPLPPRVTPMAEPRQSDVPTSMQPFRLQAATLTALAGFSIDARVLSREDYARGRESELSPTDLALGWGRMRDDAVLGQLKVWQSGRWLRYSFTGTPPIPDGEIVRSAANMHMIPASDDIARALRQVRKDDRVRIEGWLVEASSTDGWRWRSSTTRNDSGGGACELVYVCAIERL